MHTASGIGKRKQEENGAGTKWGTKMPTPNERSKLSNRAVENTTNNNIQLTNFPFFLLFCLPNMAKYESVL